MKVIALQPSVTIILDRLGCLDSLVACTKYCLEAVPGLCERDLRVIHDSWSTNTEELLRIGADLVIASVPYRLESITAILKSGRPVLALAPHALGDVYADIRHIARILGADSRGEAVIAEMKSAINAIGVQTAGIADRPLVYCEEWGKPLIHSQPWVATLVKIAGGTFLGAPGTTTTPEAVIEANPEFIIASWCGAGNRAPLEKIVAQRRWENLAAVRERRVFSVADELLNTPAPTLIGGLRALASILHPELFGEPDVDSVRRLEQIPASSV
jgi:iron complex transport system substrate-binding protein